MRLLVALALAAGCAHPQAGGPPETGLQILDEQGEPMLGTASLWSREKSDRCVQYGASCAVGVPAGVYALTFRKERAGRPGGQIGGTVQSEKQAGCLRAFVRVAPGARIVCRKSLGFGCGSGARENMDCGDASAAKSGFVPGPEDEPPQGHE